MKKLLFVLLSMLFFSSSPMMGEEKMIDLNLEIIDDSPAGPGRINIIQNDEVIYSFVIPSEVSKFEIPTYVEGECILQLITGRFCFWGIVSF